MNLNFVVRFTWLTWRLVGYPYFIINSLYSNPYTWCRYFILNLYLRKSLTICRSIRFAPQYKNKLLQWQSKFPFASLPSGILENSSPYKVVFHSKAEWKLPPWCKYRQYVYGWIWNLIRMSESIIIFAFWKPPEPTRFQQSNHHNVNISAYLTFGKGIRFTVMMRRDRQ